MANLKDIADALGATTTRVFGIDRDPSTGIVSVYWEAELLGSGETQDLALEDALASALDMNLEADGQPWR